MNKQVKSQATKILNQSKEIAIQKSRIQSQQKEINIQKNRTLSQEKKIRSQEEEIKIQENRTRSQEKKIQSLQDTIIKVKRKCLKIDNIRMFWLLFSLLFKNEYNFVWVIAWGSHAPFQSFTNYPRRKAWKTHSNYLCTQLDFIYKGIQSHLYLVFFDKIKLFAPSRLTLPGASNIRPELRNLSY